MNNRFNEAFKHLLEYEGGWSDDASDSGGPTNLGITKTTYESFVNRPVTKEELKALTDSDVKPIYHQNYWNSTRCDELPEGLDTCVFDFAVHSGPGNASKELQKIVGTTVDGVIGEKTLKRINYTCEMEGTIRLIESYMNNRRHFLSGLLARRPKDEKFRNGWFSRVNLVEERGVNAAMRSQKLPAKRPIANTVFGTARNFMKGKKTWLFHGVNLSAVATAFLTPEFDAGMTNLLGDKYAFIWLTVSTVGAKILDSITRNRIKKEGA